MKYFADHVRDLVFALGRSQWLQTTIKWDQQLVVHQPGQNNMVTQDCGGQGLRTVDNVICVLSTAVLMSLDPLDYDP